VRAAKKLEDSDWQRVRRQVLLRDGSRCTSCHEVLGPDADVHHLLPRSMGGSDEFSNLVTLCDGCHAAHHPNLAGSLARRAIEGWVIRLARWLDWSGRLAEDSGNFGPVLRIFGLARFREGQLSVVLAALAGNSVLVVSPTGSGKTLCFQLPAVLRRGVSLVVSPLKTLMAEQVSDLLRNKIPATFINSDLTPEEKDTRLSLLSRRAFKFLYIAPERFFVQNAHERSTLNQAQPAFLVIDEAHCVDQWGQDFRPEYGRLRAVRETLGSPPVLAFTATAGKEMQHRILSSLGIPDAKIFIRDVDRPNIAMLRWRCDPQKRSSEISTLLALPQLFGQKAMIYVPSVKVGDELRIALVRSGIDIPFYHSRVGTPWERQELVKRYLGQSKPAVNTIICTNAFGMGLDVPNVRLVVHWQQSASVEDMYQEFGRAGRDGKPSLSVIFHDGWTGKDASRLRYMARRTVDGAGLSEEAAEAMLRHRESQIDRVSEMLRAPACFRALGKSYFGDSETSPRRTVAEWLLDRLFGSKRLKLPQDACCDFCDAKQIAKHGHMAYASWSLGRS